MGAYQHRTVLYLVQRVYGAHAVAEARQFIRIMDERAEGGDGMPGFAAAFHRHIDGAAHTGTNTTMFGKSVFQKTAS